MHRGKKFLAIFSGIETSVIFILRGLRGTGIILVCYSYLSDSRPTLPHQHVCTVLAPLGMLVK